LALKLIQAKAWATFSPTFDKDGIEVWSKKVVHHNNEYLKKNIKNMDIKLNFLF